MVNHKVVSLESKTDNGSVRIVEIIKQLMESTEWTGAKAAFDAVGKEGSLGLITALAKKSLSDTTRLINKLSDFFAEKQLHEAQLYRALGKGIQKHSKDPSVIFTALTHAQIHESGSQIFQAIFEASGAEIQEIILDSLRSIRKVFTEHKAPFVDNTKIFSMALSKAAAVYALFSEEWNIVYAPLSLSNAGNGSDNNKEEATAAVQAALKLIKPFIPDMTEISKGELRGRMADNFTFKNYLDLFDEAVGG